MTTTEGGAMVPFVRDPRLPTVTGDAEARRVAGFHHWAGVEAEGAGTCVCGWKGSAVPGRPSEAEHQHAAHAWVAEPYMTA